jgi:hypothetical protein
MPIVLGVAATLVLVGGIIVYKVNAAAEADRIAARAEADRKAEEARRIKAEADERLRKLEQVIAEKEKALSAAKTDEERAQIRRDIERAREGRRTAPTRPRTTTTETAAPPPQAKFREKKKISDDPLEGLKL